jgi:hypothetical protein
MIHMIGPRSRKPNDQIKVVNTTSRSQSDWQRGLSPFYLGPVKLYGDFVAQNMENGWQFAKVYAQHVAEDGLPHECYFQWARKGWNDTTAHRYPMGKGAKPEYSWWDGKKLSYVEARKAIYAPLYAGAVEHTDAFKQLKALYEAEKDICLWDFDAYDHHALGMSYEDVLNCETRKMGHCFVLGMLLENKRVWL